MPQLLSHTWALVMAAVIACGPLPVAWSLACLDHRSRSSAAHRLLVVLVAWCGIQACLGLSLGSVGQLTLQAVLVAEMVVGVVGLVALRRVIRRVYESVGEAAEEIPGWVRTVPIAALSALALALAWRLASSLILEYDSLAFHLPTMAVWYQTGSLGILEQFELMVGRYPYNWELIGTLFLFPFRGDFAVALPNLVAWGVLGLSVYALAREAGARGHHAMTGACGVLTLPIVLSGLQSLHVDLPFAAFFMAGFYFVLRGARTRSRVGLALATLSAGLLLGTKVSGIAYAGLIAVVGLVMLRRRRVRQEGVSAGPAAPSWSALVAVAAMALLLGLFWYARNLLSCGSPLGNIGVKLGPFELFPGAIYPDALVETTLAGQFALGHPQHWLTLLEQLWTRLGVPGVLVALLALGLPLAVRGADRLRHRLVLVLVLGATVVLFWHTPFTAKNASVQGITTWIGGQFRFAMPALGALGVAAAIGASVVRMPEVVAVPVVVVLCGLAAARQGLLLPAGFLLVISVAACWLLTGPARRLRVMQFLTARPVLGCGCLVLAALAVMGSLHARVRHDDARRLRFGRVDSFLDRELADGEPIGYMLSERVYPLFGPALDRRVVYVQARNPGLETWLARVRGELVYDQSDDTDLDGWLGKLDANGVRMIAVGPIPRKWQERHELSWLESHERPFEPVCGTDPVAHMVIYAPVPGPTGIGRGGRGM